MAFLNLEVAARELGISRNSLRLAAKAGKVPGARKVGGRWFIHRATFERYFAQTLPVDSAPQAAA
jgi:predicted site-specific integrase-resolvase